MGAKVGKSWYTRSRLNKGAKMENLKKMAGIKAAEYVKDGMVVGLGTGSTILWKKLDGVSRKKD